MCSFKELYLSAYVSVGADLIAVEQLHNGHLDDRRKWPLYAGGLKYIENLRP